MSGDAATAAFGDASRSEMASESVPFVVLDRTWLRYYDADEDFAVEDISQRIARGEFVAVVGPSGCGKSTLLKLVSGLQLPNQGMVSVDGRQVDRPLQIAGMAFQNPSLLPWRSVLRNVILPLEVVADPLLGARISTAQREQRARDLLALVGLAGADEKNVWQLSGGMQQRVSLCRALVHNPSLLMLDEPFGALDVFTREDLWTILQDIWLVKRPTVLLVTHDLREAIYLADRVIVMSARPRRIIAECAVELPRPRTAAMTYTTTFQNLQHELRDAVEIARFGRKQDVDG